jgi:hypothetical protein
MRRSALDVTSEIDVGTFAAPVAIDDTSHHGVLIGSTDGSLTYFTVSIDGANAPVWKLAQKFLVPVIAQVVPAAGDIDGDGEAEIVVGDAEGRLHLGHLRSNAFVSQAWALDTFKVNQNASPSLVDLDRDGDLDIMVGTGGGRFLYLQNDGTRSSPSFARATPPHPFDTLDVGNDAAPRFAFIDADTTLDAIIGARLTNSVRGVIRFLVGRDGHFDPDSSLPDIVGPRNPTPMFLRYSSTDHLVVGTTEGGLVDYVRNTPTKVADEDRGKSDRQMTVSTTTDGDLILHWNAARIEPFVVADVTGRVVFRTTLQGTRGSARVSIRHLAAGLYFWRSGSVSGRFVECR